MVLLDYQGVNMLDLAFDLLFLALNRHRVIPLYTQVDARRFTESRLAHTQTIQVIHTWRFILLGLKSPLVLGRQQARMICHLHW